MSVVSGELHYCMGSANLPVSSYLADYLSCDRSLEFQRKVNNKRMEQLLHLKQKVLKSYFAIETAIPVSCCLGNANVEKESKQVNQQVSDQKLDSMLAVKRNFILESARKKLFYSHDKLERLRSLNDANLMQLILEYGTICRNEVERSRRLLSNEASAVNDAKEQSKKLHSLFLFAHHIAAESHGVVRLSTLHYDTPASLRCRKAVYDNTRKGYLESLRIDKVHIDTVI